MYFKTKHYLNSQSQLLSWLLASIVLICLSFIGIPNSIDNTTDNVRSAIFTKTASENIIIAEMDVKSIQEIGQWPWDRSIHAQLVDRLSAANANSIAFDVDFSSQSNAKADNEFSRAINDSDSNVILATFLQQGASQNIYESLPRPEFSKNAILASVNVTPNAQGQIDTYDYAHVTGGKVRPTLASILSGNSGNTNERFTIDKALDPNSLKRVSVVDIINNTYSAEAFKGKDIIVGATAIELGDRYATPVHGVLPGVYIHALASETLNNEMNIPTINIFLTMAVTIILLILFQYFSSKSKAKKYLLIYSLFLLIGFVAAEIILYTNGIAYLQSGLAIAFLISYLTIHTINNLLSSVKNEQYRDAITRLPNKKYMEKSARGMRRKRIAIAHISNYSEINSVTSDEKIKSAIHKIASRLQFMSSNDLVYMVGGNQLAWFIDDGVEDLESYFETISAFFLSPLQVDNQRLRFKVHCGFNESDTLDFERILANAALAAYQSENIGYRWVPYSDDMQKIAGEKLSIISDIDKAMDDGEIWLAYQPKLNMDSNAVESAEALVRWQHSTIGTIGPDLFIPILEKENRITDLTRFIIKQTLKDVAQWNAMGKKLNCSINISAAILQDTDFIKESIALVVNSDVDCAQITFEITETSSLEDMEQATAILNIVRESGIMVSIDDYGTGQSTLSYLRGFPANEIKIDQSFIKLMASNDVDRLMVGSTIQMAHQMNFKVVAEGVEDETSLNLLRKFGCDVAQGWHIGRPIDAQSFAQTWVLPQKSVANSNAA